MKFSKGRNIALIASALVFCLLYFAFPRVGPKEANLKEKAPVAEADLTALQEKALNTLSADSQKMVKALGDEAKNNRLGIEDRAAAAKQLSGLWYRKNFFELAGKYAAEVAELENTAAAWNIAGNSYMHGLVVEEDQHEREHLATGAAHAFKKATDLEPDNIDYRISLATVYTEVPDQENPMMGIQQLLELNRKHPEDTKVLTVLGKLAIKTGQYDKAIIRLEKVRVLDAKNTEAACLLSFAYDGVGKKKEAEALKKYCQ